MEIVRVGSFREVNRTDESVIFSALLPCGAGSYTVSAMVRDVGGSRAATQQATGSCSHLQGGRLSTPSSSYEATGRSTLDSALPSCESTFERRLWSRQYVGFTSRRTVRESPPIDFVVRNDKERNYGGTRPRLHAAAALQRIVSVPISTGWCRPLLRFLQAPR